MTDTPSLPRDEDGYELWLRYRLLPQPRRATLAAAINAIATGAETPILAAARSELERGLAGLLGLTPGHVVLPEATPTDAPAALAGRLVLGTPATLPLIASLDLPLATLRPEGYVVRALATARGRLVVIAGNDAPGVLYGVFALLRHLQLGGDLNRLDLVSAPDLALRLLDHWDNLDRTVERGYAGFSIWDWWTLPDYIRPHYRDYARASASIGLNGAVLNNVNASPDMLSDYYLRKVVGLADTFRPWGIKVYLSVNFAAPMVLDGLATADPLDPDVRAWWRDKAAAIYDLIPDFGGFLVKANSEGQPGPQDFGRSHADGANMLAEAVAPHGGIVMWRAFVYAPDTARDRHAQAYDEFQPLDGAFADNVIVQVKNGPLDFQPREPFSPLFGAMPNTPLMLELQVTKEYLGQATHVCYLGPLFQEVLGADTGIRPEGATVADVIAGRVTPQRLTGIAAVANIGTDRDWTGGVFNQANWYAYGRLAWDTGADAAAIAIDWVRLTLTDDAEAVGRIVAMMLLSREAVVNYVAPFGLAHQMATSHHYGPGPWVDDLERADWNPTYYAQAGSDGIGFDRTAAGSRALLQYAPPVQAAFADPRTIDEGFLLWFHHMPWDFVTRSGRTLWDALVARYDQGVAEVAAMRAAWRTVRPLIDAERFTQVETFLAIQAREARWWRDASIAYFQTFAQRPLPKGHAAPPHDLAYYKALTFPRAPGI